MFRLSCALMHTLVFLESPGGAQGSNGKRRHSRRLRGQRDVPEKSAYYDPGHYTKKQEFELVCRDELRSKAADGMLSQVEFAAFLFDFCSDDPQRGPACEEELSFLSLAPEIQLNFVGGFCPSDAITRLECLEFLNNQDEVFGYTEELEELCVSTSALLGSSGLLDFGDSILVTLPSVESELTDASPETDTDFEAPIDPSTSLEREKTRKQKKDHIKGMSKAGKKDRKDSFEGMAKEARVVEPSSILSPDSINISSTPITELHLDPNSLSPTTSTTSPPGPFDISPTSTSTPNESVNASEEEISSEKGISMASRLGLSAAGFAVVILAVCSASKRRRTESEIMFKDSALDGGESIISVDSGVVGFSVQNGATLNVNEGGGAGCGRKPSTSWPRSTIDRFKDPSSQDRSFGDEMSEHERSNILWGSAISSRGFFRRRSARIRRNVFDNRSNDGDATLEDDSTIEGKAHTEVDNSAPRTGTKSESDQIAGGSINPVGNEAEDFGGPVSRREWRSKASRPFYTVFGVSNGDKCTEVSGDLNGEEEEDQVNFEEVQSMSRSDWKSTLVNSCDDETSLGSLAAVSAEVRKQFKDFDVNLTKGFVDLDTRKDDSHRAPNAEDDDSVISGQSLHLDILAKELTSCDGESIDRVKETDGSSEDAALASPSEVSPQTSSSDVKSSRQRRDNRVNAVLVEDKPWRRETQGKRSTKISKTAKIAEKFESSRPNPARADLASRKNPQEEEDGQKHVTIKSLKAKVELGPEEISASTPLPSLPLEESGNEQKSQQDDDMLVDAACNGVNALRNMFEGPSHSSPPAVAALLAARRQDY